MTKRLQIILDEIEPCKCLADVGCDHGIISLKVLQNHKAKRILATDISQKCLDKAIELLKENDLTGSSEFACVNGLPNESCPDEVLIAGMGGLEIISILNNYFTANKNRPLLILQPMRDEYKLRQFLNRFDYSIYSDYIFKDKKLYRLIKARPGQQVLTQKQMFFGAVEQEYSRQEFKEFLNGINTKYTKKLHNTPNFDKKTQKIKKILQECENLKSI